MSRPISSSCWKHSRILKRRSASTKRTSSPAWSKTRCWWWCYNLFDKTEFAYQKALQWGARGEEFVKRAGFVLIAALAIGRSTESSPLSPRLDAIVTFPLGNAILGSFARNPVAA